MRSRLCERILFCFLLAPLLSWGDPSALGYVLQGPHLLELMIEKMGPARSLSVQQSLLIYRTGSPSAAESSSVSAGSEPPPQLEYASPAEPLQTDQNIRAVEKLELEETLRYVFSRAFRSDVRSLYSERIFISANGQTLTIIDGHIMASAENQFDRYKDLLLFRSRQALLNRLLDLGVDVSITSLGRFEGKITYVLGAEYPDAGASQIWLDHATFLPLRWIVKDKPGQANSDLLEFRYLAWQPRGHTYYPARIEFWQQGNLVRVNQVKTVDLNPAFTEELFDIEHLKTLYPQAAARPIRSAESEIPNEVQETIEEFKRIFE
jgi:outer membrane lipoprotein-sorting protein